jgi:phosphopantothenoylcysteine decarboxylase/phosphopantothenate--cysteine ligase
MLKNKRVVLGITGSIAAYKSAELTREFTKKGANVRVIMSENAKEFIAPLTLQTLSGNPVYSDMFSLTEKRDIAHINLAQTADIIVIAPATANIIGKIASGISDDLLSTTVMATKAPVLLCPAMNTNMYTNTIYQGNIKKLLSVGFYLTEADCGELACSTEGPGRLAPPGDIVERVESILTVKDLTGQKMLITAGPTREPLDPVRYITNYSSGKMGYALAKVARRRGADVMLISGPTSLDVPTDVEFVGVSSAVEMRDAVMERVENATVIIKAAAVSDYRPSKIVGSKIKKSNKKSSIALELNPDIIFETGKMKGDRILIGFAMETEDIINNARNKLIEKNMDLIVANDLRQEGAGFQHNTNIVKLLDREGTVEELPLMDKMEVAEKILDRVSSICKKRK